MLALSSSTDLALVSSPTLTVTTTSGTTSQYSLSGLSGTNTMLNFGGLCDVYPAPALVAHLVLLVLFAALSRLLNRERPGAPKPAADRSPLQDLV